MIISSTITEGKSRFSPILFSTNYIEGIRNSKEMGFEGVELHIRDPKNVDLDSIKKEISKQQIKLTAIGTGLSYVDEGLHFTSDNINIRKAAIQRMKDYLDAFSDLKPMIILGTIKGLLKNATNIEAAKERMENCIIECCKYAEKLDMEICLEAINRYEQDCFNTLAETAQFIKKVRCNNLYLHIDTFHMNIEEVSFVQPIFEYKDIIGHIHFADNNRHYPGSGRINFLEIMLSLEKIMYNRAISIECLPIPDGETAAKRSIQYLKYLKQNLFK